MDYFAGLDISMDETHVCVLDREGEVVRESKAESTAQAVANELSKAPSCRRIVFETGRMAPILFHGLSQLGLPVVCVESRQAYQALKSLATHKTDRNDARGLAHLARTGFFKPVHVKSLQAHALRSLIIARKKLVGQRVTLENQIRGLAVVFGIRLPRALTAAFVNQALKASEGIAGLSAAMRGLIAARTAVRTAVAAIDADMRRMTRASAACRRLMTIPGVGQLTALAFVAAIDDPSRICRSRDIGAYLGLVPRRNQSGELDYVGGISKCGDRRVRTLLYEAANVVLCDLRLPGLDGPGLYDWMTEHRPHLCARTAFITADTLSASSHRFLARAGRPVLEKPFVPAELRQLLAQLLPDAQP
jgi:transposase